MSGNGQALLVDGPGKLLRDYPLHLLASGILDFLPHVDDHVELAIIPDEFVDGIAKVVVHGGRDGACAQGAQQNADQKQDDEIPGKTIPQQCKHGQIPSYLRFIIAQGKCRPPM